MARTDQLGQLRAADWSMMQSQEEAIARFGAGVVGTNIDDVLVNPVQCGLADRNDAIFRSFAAADVDEFARFINVADAEIR